MVIDWWFIQLPVNYCLLFSKQLLRETPQVVLCKVPSGASGKENMKAVDLRSVSSSKPLYLLTIPLAQWDLMPLTHLYRSMHSSYPAMLKHWSVIQWIGQDASDWISLCFVFTFSLWWAKLDQRQPTDLVTLLRWCTKCTNTRWGRHRQPQVGHFMSWPLF